MGDTAKMRRPKFDADAPKPTGSVTHDERGNAVWKWAADVDVAAVAGPDASLPPELSLDRRAGPRDPASKPVGTGCDPYTSGAIDPGRRQRKRDLRALSREIAAKKAAGETPTG